MGLGVWWSQDAFFTIMARRVEQERLYPMYKRSLRNDRQGCQAGTAHQGRQVRLRLTDGVMK